MPEGHVIHRIARDHSLWYAGKRTKVSSPQGRFEKEAEFLSGKVLKSIEAHGKHLFYRWSGSKTVHIHLGLYGKFRQYQSEPPAPRGQVRLRVIAGERAFDLNGPNACHLVTKDELAAIMDRLGPDPLCPDSDHDQAWRRISRSRAAIGTLLLDQSVIAGIGNIYRSEILYLLGIHPETRGKELSADQFELLWTKLTQLMQVGVKYNRIIIADPKIVGKTRSRMNRDERLLVYKRKLCMQCDKDIQSWQLGSRTVYACLNCQQ